MGNTAVNLDFFIWIGGVLAIASIGGWLVSRAVFNLLTTRHACHAGQSKSYRKELVELVLVIIVVTVLVVSLSLLVGYGSGIVDQHDSPENEGRHQVNMGEGYYDVEVFVFEGGGD